MKKSSYADETRRCTWIAFRMIVRHFNKELQFDEYKLFLKKKYKYPKNILTKNDVLKMIDTAESKRTQLILALLFNLGCRPAEFSNLRKRDITIDEDGVIASLCGKTGERHIRIVNVIDCKHDLEAYLQSINENDKLFNFGVTRMEKILREIGYRSGLSQRMSGYVFRHSSATFMANYLTESQLCIYYGWVMSSQQSRIYVHLSTRDLSPRIIDVNSALRQKEIITTPPIQPPQQPQIEQRVPAFQAGNTREFLTFAAQLWEQCQQTQQQRVLVLHEMKDIKNDFMYG